jgi:excinuclease ABC subunit C
LGIQDKVTMVGLAKNLEELFFVNDSHSIQLQWNSEAHKLIRNIRDEVHRFGIQFHRSKRSKGALETGLRSHKRYWATNQRNAITLL